MSTSPSGCRAIPGLCQGSCYGSKWSAASAHRRSLGHLLGTPAASCSVVVGLQARLFDFAEQLLNIANLWWLRARAAAAASQSVLAALQR